MTKVYKDLYFIESTKFSIGGSVGPATLGESTLLGDTLLSTVPMPLLNTSTNVPTSLANYMMANLMAEHARIFQQGQYSMTPGSMNYLQSNSLLPPMSGLSPHIQNMASPQITSIPTILQDDAKSCLINKSIPKPPKLTEMLSQEPTVSSNVSDLSVSMKVSRALTSCNPMSKVGTKSDK